MNDLAAYAYPFVLAIVALAAGCLLLGRRLKAESSAAPRLLFARGTVAAVAGFLLVWLGARRGSAGRNRSSPQKQSRAGFRRLRQCQGSPAHPPQRAATYSESPP